VDHSTGYRYYTFEQLSELNRLIALRDLGFTLEQVQSLLQEGPTVEQMRGMLRLRQAQLEQEIGLAEARLTQVRLRLNWLEKEQTMPAVDVLIKNVPAMTVAGARAVAYEPAAMREHCIALDAEACALIRTGKLATDGVSFALYYAQSGEAGIDVEMAYAVQPPAMPVHNAGRAAVHELPAAQVAYAVYHGSYDDFAAVGEVHAAIVRWAEAQGYRVVSPSREFYVQPPRSPRNALGVMEIQYPVERAPK